MIWSDLLKETESKLKKIENYEFEAKQIILNAAGVSNSQWSEIEKDSVTTRSVASVDRSVGRRLSGEPLQYVLGSWSFRHLDLMVDKRVLIPRPETEEVVGWAIESLVANDLDMRRLKVADLGAGSGAIGLSIAYEVPQADVWITDYSSDCLEVARANLAGLGVKGSSVRISQGDWFDAFEDQLKDSFDLIISNPPYISPTEQLDSSVLDWEPNSALISSPNGDEFVNHLIDEANNWLAPGGILVLEMAPWQVEPAVKRANKIYSTVVSKVDLSGNPRSIIATKHN